MVLRIFMVLALACMPFSARAANAGDDKVITIVADLWCPINCDPAGNRPGLGIEIAKEIFEPLGYTVNYIVIPWARALSEVRTGDVDAVIGANKNDDPTLVFPQTPIARMTDDFYVVKNSPLVFTDINALQKLRLGIIHDYGYSDAVEKLIATNRGIPGMVQEVSGDNALEQNVLKLMAGRIDVLVESHIVMDDKLKVMKLQDEVHRIGSIPQGNIYLAFSQALPQSKDLAQQFDTGIKRLNASHKLDALYAAYGVTP